MHDELYWDERAKTSTFSTPLCGDDLEALGLSKDAGVLDAGCGYGRTLQQLYGAGFSHLNGVDVSSAMIERAREATEAGIHYEVAPIQQLPFAAPAFDIVLLLGVVCSTPDDMLLRAAFEEIHRVLKPGGLLLINDFDLGLSERELARYLACLPETGLYGCFIEEGKRFRHRTCPLVENMAMDLFETVSLNHIPVQTMRGHDRLCYRLVLKKRD